MNEKQKLKQNIKENLKLDKNKRKTLIRLIKYLGDQKLMITLALLLTLITNIMGLLGPRLSGRAIDSIKFGAGKVDFTGVYKYFWLMILLYIGASIFRFLLGLLMIKMSQKIAFKLRKQVFEKLASMPVSYFDNNQTGDLISRVTYDIKLIYTALSQDVVQIFTAIVTVVFSLSMMISISPILIIIFAFTIPVTVIFTRKMALVTRPLFRNRSAKIGEFNGYVEEIVSAQSVIKAYRQEETMIERFAVKNTATADASYNAEFQSSVVGPTMNFINNLSLGLVSLFGSLLFMNGQITIGQISTFILYSRRFTGPINELANITAELQSSLSAAERVFRVLDEAPEKGDDPDAVVLENVRGHVQIENLKFGYDPEKLVIENLNIDARPGQLIAIVGKTGAGKTTIINLLMRFYDPQSGSIKIDGHPTDKVTRLSLRKTFAMVLQDTWLFQGTILENIRYGRPESTMEEVVRAAKSAKIHSYITKLPKGYETLVEEAGQNLSQGQKQLISIARAMLLDARILILDEATSNVDTNTEHEIKEAMDELMHGRTSFIIAHRLSTIKNADRILVFSEGKIAEQGTHRDLLAADGVYAAMFNSQFN